MTQRTGGPIASRTVDERVLGWLKARSEGKTTTEMACGTYSSSHIRTATNRARDHDLAIATDPDASKAYWA